MTPSSARRRPRQARSQQRVERVLDAAQALLDEGGYEALTVKAIAVRADVAIGSLYQFFANKREIVSALGQRYIEQVAHVIDELADTRFNDWEQALDTVFDAYVDYYRREAGFRALWVDEHLDDSLHQADRQLNDLIASAVRGIIEPLMPCEIKDPAFHFAYVVELGDSMLDFAFRGDPSGDERVVAATRSLIHHHLARQLPTRRARRAG